MDAIELMRTTGSCRRFRPDPIPDAVLARVFDPARFGPQGGNRQPVRYVVVRDAARKARLAEWYLARARPIFESYRSGGYRVGGTEPSDDLPPMIREGLHLAEHARIEGLGTCLTTLLCADEPRVKELLGMPDDVIVAAVIPLGYPERPLPTRLSRAPVADLVYADRYGAPLFSGGVP